jgi:hypothetical protein
MRNSSREASKNLGRHLQRRNLERKKPREEPVSEGLDSPLLAVPDRDLRVHVAFQDVQMFIDDQQHSTLQDSMSVDFL